MADAIPVPPEAEQALALLQQQLGNALVAVYLHGSAVAGGLRPDSDVDLLAVVDRPLLPSDSARLVAELMKISKHPREGSATRPLEVIIVQRANLSASIYPARSEFLYGEWLRDAFEAGEVPAPESNPDLTLVLAQARQRAQALIGPAANEVLPAIPQADIRRAIGDALPALLADLEGDERNVLLTLARMWRTLVTGEFVSKDAAAEWAEARLPAEHAAVLADARKGYLGTGKDNWQTRRQEARQTADYLHECIVSAL